MFRLFDAFFCSCYDPFEHQAVSLAMMIDPRSELRTGVDFLELLPRYLSKDFLEMFRRNSKVLL